MSYLIYAINPGSTSTKLALYRDETELFRLSAEHSPAELAACGGIAGQAGLRLGLARRALADHGIHERELAAVVGRGGMLPPVKPGGYLVNQLMLDTLQSEMSAPHASNLGAALADAIARPLGIPAYIYDAISSADLPPVARVTGFPEMTRQSLCHVLNSRAVAMRCAAGHGRAYDEMSFLVAHLGGGISFSAHHKGRIIDSMADDDGAFSPERSGGVPVLSVIKMCYSGRFTEKEMARRVRGKGGLTAHLGTTDCREIERRIAGGDRHAALVYSAQAYQIVKGIGVMAAAMKGDVDVVILTGGLAYSKLLTDEVTDYVKFIAPVEIFPGENELEALARGALRILRGEEAVHTFVGEE